MLLTECAKARALQFDLLAGLNSKALVTDDDTLAAALDRQALHSVKTPFTFCSKYMQLSAELSTIVVNDCRKSESRIIR